MTDTKKLFKVLVLGGLLAAGAGTAATTLAGCGGSSEGQNRQQGQVTDGGGDGGARVADGGAGGHCIWGGDPCPC